MSKALIKQELRNSLYELQSQKLQVRRQAEKMSNKDAIVSPYELQNMNGDFIMASLLVAEAQVLAALANLEE